MYKIIKYVLKFFPIIWLYIIFDPIRYGLFWKWAWYFLVFLMFIRPLRDVFPWFKVFWRFVPLRKELWIISWVFAISHVVWYFLVNKLPASFLFNWVLWDPTGYLGWWMFAFLVSLVLLFTSNIFSMIKLWKYWKKIQRLSYLMFLFVAIHISLIKEDAMITTSLIIISYIFLYVIAYFKNKK